MNRHTDRNGKVFRCVRLVDAALGCALIVAAVIVAAVMVGSAPCNDARRSAQDLTVENAYLRHVEAERAAILGPDDPIGPAARMARLLDSLRYESNPFSLVSVRVR